MAQAKANMQTPARDMSAMAFLAPLAAWVFPGAGHFIQRRWGRGALLFASVTVMFFLGLMMQGKIYRPNTGDILEMLGFVGNLSAGGLYFLARAMDWGQGAIHRAVANYGTMYVIAAGLLNLICAVDAYHIAIGKKQ